MTGQLGDDGSPLARYVHASHMTVVRVERRTQAPAVSQRNHIGRGVEARRY